MSNEEIVNNIIEKYELDLGEEYIYVGASIVKTSIFPNYVEVLFCEDNFIDENGIPYIMAWSIPINENTQKLLVEGKIALKERLIIFYTKDLRKRYVIPVDGENWILIGNEIPENVKNINYEKAQKIIHRKTLEVKKEPIELSKDEINQLVNKYKKTYKKGRMVFAGILSTFLWGMIVSLLDIFIGAYVGQNFKPEAIIPVLLGGLIIFIIGSILIIKFFLNIPVKRIKKFKYRSEFLVYNWKRDFNVKGVADSHIIGGSFDGNICKELVYGIWHNDISFIEGVENLEIVYRYSKSKYPNNLEYCLFVRKNII